MVASKHANKLTKMINPMQDGNEHLRLNGDEMIDEDCEVITGRRVIEVGGSVKYEAYSVDPTGFWRIKASKGKLPDELSGQYTSASMGQRAIEAYLRTNKLH